MHVTTLTDDYFHYSESTYELIGETTAKRYKLYQKVKIVVAATDPFMRTIDFRVVTGTEDEENEKIKPEVYCRIKICGVYCNSSADEKRQCRQ